MAKKKSTPSKPARRRTPALIGMVHVRALPGSPGAELPVDKIVDLAVREAAMLVGAGFDGLIIENMHDAPYVHPGDSPEVVACMARAAGEIRRELPHTPMGVQVLSGGNRGAIAVAHAVGAGVGGFIRCENFVFSHVADEGLLARAEAGDLLRYRRMIGAAPGRTGSRWPFGPGAADAGGGVLVYADVKKKHASHALTADLSIADCVEAAEFFGADGVIVTGTATGRAADAADVAAARGATALPVLVGSGVTAASAGSLLGAGADGLIVGSWIKKGGRWSGDVDAGRAKEMAAAFAAARG